jgi:histidine triad (HIT) family protein
MAEQTLFTRILAGEIPAQILYRDEHCFAIRDINPKAPTHLLLIPAKPIPRLVDAAAEDQALLGHLLLTAGKIATAAGIGDACRIIINNGEGGGQTVFHLHLHILGNVEMTEDSLGF